MSPTQVSPESTALASSGPALSDGDFRRFRELIYKVAGITLGDTKKQLVSSRLAKRLRALGLASYDAYYAVLAASDLRGEEMREFINCITTNKTDFFRERHHFDFLKATAFPALRERAMRGAPRLIKIWSAGCSTGEEPYTLALTLLSDFGENSGWRFEILATDIDTNVLERAARGVYNEETVAPVPPELRQRYFKRGSGEQAGLLQVDQALRQMITFQRLNFVETPWNVSGPFDLIFCRNVMIYFDRPTQEKIIAGFRKQLQDGGYLFLGHSETMHGQASLFQALRGTIYRATGSSAEPRELSTAAAAVPAAAAPPSRLGRAKSVAGVGNAPTPSRAGDPLPRVNLIIGGVRASRDPVRLRTVLGSCVCACIFDPVAKVGGMNHFMLPDGLPDQEMPTRYGVHAMEMLINDILRLGGERARLQAKAFGAAHVLAESGLSADVPRKNARFIKQFLEQEGIPLLSSRLGGSSPVEILFQPTVGQAHVRALGEQEARSLAREESKFDLEIKRQLTTPKPMEVELF